MKVNLDTQAIINDYKNGMGAEKIALKYHVGKIKIKNILVENGITLKKRGGQTQNINYIVSDWKIEKYPVIEGYHYVAIFNEDGKEFCDHMNQGGFLTSYIKEKIGIEIPTLYDRRKYYMETGNYWWEQWFRIEQRKNKPTKKCPYCNWETEDINNRAGVFEQHLKERHNITKEEYLSQYPGDKVFFTLVNKTLNRQMSDNKNEFITCAICGKKLARIDWRHLKEHGITKEQYIQKYGFNTVSKQLHDTMSAIAISSNMEMELTAHSKPELEIMGHIKTYGIECKSNRKILHGKEIDIFVIEKNIGIEYNGNVFHTEWRGKKNKNYHLFKTEECKRNGVALIQIFEDEYFLKKEIVLNKISHILKLDTTKEKIFARKCKIKTLYTHEANEFLERFHIQGFDPSTIHYGAFYEDKLIAVMSFLRSKKDSHDWELTRFASDYNYICCGVGGKLFKHFIKEYNPNSVKSFADRRWTVDEENNVYIQLGFKFDGYIPPDYKYYNPKVDRYKRFHKFGFRKKALLKKHPDRLVPEMTETEMVKELGYDRIWDCGLIKYVWHTNETQYKC